MKFGITINPTKVVKFLSKAASQADFALAKTLTGAAYTSRAAVQANLPKWLDIRKPFLQRSVVYDRATKQTLYSQVRILARAHLASLLEEGGTRQPRKRAFPVPVNATKDNKNIPKARRPSAILARKDTFSGTINGVAGIWQSLPGQRIKLIYAYEPQTKYEPNKIYFYRTVKAVSQKYIKANLDRNIREAFKTAKK